MRQHARIVARCAHFLARVPWRVHRIRCAVVGRTKYGVGPSCTVTITRVCISESGDSCDNESVHSPTPNPARAAVSVFAIKDGARVTSYLKPGRLHRITDKEGGGDTCAVR